MSIHFVIPDTQAKPGVPTAHLSWIGRYLVEKFADRDVKVIHLGDHADMPSLSSWDKGKRAMEGRRYVADIDAANHAFDVLCAPLDAHNAKRRRLHEKQWEPERHILLGNHENRITRACESDAQFDGLLSLDHLNYASHGWQVHDFLDVMWLDGVAYSHYFYNPMTGRPYSGENLKLRLKNIGHSFTQGHQQTLDYAIRYVGGQGQHGLVAGACLTPDHRVLTADLRYVPLGDLVVGDRIVSFDENVSDSPGRSRRYRTGTVEAMKFEDAEVFRVTLDNGHAFKVTGDHLWLTRVGGPSAVREGASYQWRTTAQLRVGTRVPQLLDTWDTLTTRDAGYLAGMFDGEGCYYTRTTAPGTVGQLSLSQKAGTVLDETERLLSDLCGVEGVGHENQRGVTSLRIKGGLPNIAKVLGQLRPLRLLPKFAPEHLGSLSTGTNYKVASIEPAGVQTIVRLAVDAKTMIVDGVPHHNCYLHDEDYRGPQGNAHWRGIIVCYAVGDGSYDPKFVSLDSLCQRYERVTLAEYMAELPEAAA